MHSWLFRQRGLLQLSLSQEVGETAYFVRQHIRTTQERNHWNRGLAAEDKHNRPGRAQRRIRPGSLRVLCSWTLTVVTRSKCLDSEWERGKKRHWVGEEGVSIDDALWGGKHQLRKPAWQRFVFVGQAGAWKITGQQVTANSKFRSVNSNQRLLNLKTAPRARNYTLG